MHVTWLGGAFGRKSKPDFVVEAAGLALLASRDYDTLCQWMGL